MNFTNAENVENLSKDKIKLAKYDKIPQLVTIFGTLFIGRNLQLSMLSDFEEKRRWNILNLETIFQILVPYFQRLSQRALSKILQFKYFNSLN